MSHELLANPAARRALDAEPSRAPLAFHRALPGYAPTPLVDAPALAAELGLGRMWLKDESSRLGLPAFKIVGASWAVAFALAEWAGERPPPEEGLEGLRRLLRGRPAPTLVAATDGNHGRAVARMARLLDLPARIFVPDDMVAARREGIASEGAEIVEVAGGYDAAVARSAQEADARHVVVSDTSWPGYERVPAAVAEGYATILWEVEEELARRGERVPDVVVAQVGVGAFAVAVARHFRRPGLAAPPALVSLEPVGAQCVLASVRAGCLVSLPPARSIMAGLNCGTPSRVALPVLTEAFDLFVAIDDELARGGMRALARAGVVGGECSGGGVGALLAPGVQEALGLGPGASALVFLTEGATDPEGYRRAVQVK